MAAVTPAEAEAVAATLVAGEAATPAEAAVEAAIAAAIPVEAAAAGLTDGTFQLAAPAVVGEQHLVMVPGPDRSAAVAYAATPEQA